MQLAWTSYGQKTHLTDGGKFTYCGVKVFVLLNEGDAPSHFRISDVCRLCLANHGKDIEREGDTSSTRTLRMEDLDSGR